MKLSTNTYQQVILKMMQFKKVAQDIVLLKIGNSKYNKNITVKGGVVMHNISKDMRRATRDMDIDFIKYSLEDKSIRNVYKRIE